MKRSSINIIVLSCFLAVLALACGSTGDQNNINKDTLITNAPVGQPTQPISQPTDSGPSVAHDTTPVNCDKTALTTVENFQVWKLKNGNAIAFNAKMAIDADGSPNAYCPDNKGLDFTANAGKPGNWFGVVTDRNGEPVVQKDSDPSPGCYVSATTMVDNALSRENPLKYVNSEKIPFIVLPPELLTAGNIRIGDFAYVFNTKNKKASFAIFADGGPRKKLGEGSVFLAEQLGINKSPRNGGTGKGIIYIVFPHSGKGNGTLRTLEEINASGQTELNKIGGAGIIDCLQL